MVTVPTGVRLGWVVSSTVTDPCGNTSQFSQNVRMLAIGDTGVTFSLTPALAAHVDGSLTKTVTVSENEPATTDGVIVTDNLLQAFTDVEVTTSATGVTPAISGGIVMVKG